MLPNYVIGSFFFPLKKWIMGIFLPRKPKIQKSFREKTLSNLSRAETSNERELKEHPTPPH